MPGSENSNPLISSTARRLLPEQRAEPTPDAKVDAHPRILRIGAIHVVALFVGHHLQRELVVIAHEQRPLAGWPDRRRLRPNVGQRKAILHPHRHEHARHDRKVKRHLAFLAFLQIRDRVLGPLIGLRQQHAVGEMAVDVGCAARARTRASQADSRNWCPRARTDMGPRQGAIRRRRGQARNRPPAAFPCAPPDCRSSDPADAKRSDGNSMPSRPDPRTSSRARNPGR